MSHSRYYNDFIKCHCGHSFRNFLETRLSDHLWGSVENEAKEEEECKCPQCNTMFSIEISVEKKIELTYSKVTPIGQFVDTDGGDPFNLSSLKDRWVGENVTHINDESILISPPDGTYQVSGKEYKIEQGVILECWNQPDHNQTELLLEECAI
jgi:hypothetical protein